MKATLNVMLLLLLVSPLLAQQFNTQRPNPEEPTRVEVGLVISDIDDIDDAEQSFVANFYFQARWHDPRLEHKGLGSMRVSLDSIWHPSFQMLNQQKVWATLPRVALVENDGTVILRARVWGNFSQPLHLEDFPLDTQEFMITIVALGNKKDDLFFQVDSLSGVTRTPSVAGWKIVSDTVDTESVHVTEAITTQATLNIRFKAERETGYYIYNVILPLMIIVMMSWIAFWLPVSELGTRVGIAITSMLTVMAYRFMIHNDLPTISYLTRMDVLVMESTVIVFFTLVEDLIANLVGRRKGEEKGKKVDSVAKWLFPVLLGLSLARWFLS
ncbi:hypothetical protein [Algivirga pacifica]|uniref:Neurotransmitter-gated ion-channel ligand-binding domain-containing protein n=1 Tax=Algivirga pacifica TaxID=1162670 RepID=A0ABP9DL31_9BACT